MAWKLSESILLQMPMPVHIYREEIPIADTVGYLEVSLGPRLVTENKILQHIAAVEHMLIRIRLTTEE